MLYMNTRGIAWVNKQRIAYRKNNITEERMKRLEDIGFQWKLGK